MTLQANAQGELTGALSRLMVVSEQYPNLKAIRWVQDEPRNMGPWPHYQLNVWPHVDAQVEQRDRKPPDAIDD